MYNIVTFKFGNKSIYIKNKNTVLVLLKANVIICCAFVRQRQYTCVCAVYGILLTIKRFNEPIDCIRHFLYS